MIERKNNEIETEEHDSHNNNSYMSLCKRLGKLVFQKLPLEAKQYELISIRMSFKEMGTDLTKEFVTNLVLSGNKYYTLVQKHKQLTNAQVRNTEKGTRKTNQKNTMPYIQRTALDKLIREKIVETVQSIKVMKKEHNPDYYRYNTALRRISALFRFIPMPYYFVGEAHTNSHVKTNTVCLGEKKRLERKISKVRKLEFPEYIRIRENEISRMNAWNEIRDGVIQKRRRIEKNNQLDHEELRIEKIHENQDKHIELIRNNVKELFA